MPRRLIILLLLFLSAWGNTIAGQTQYEVTANTLNVRSGPSTYYSVVYKLHKGDVVVVLEQKGQWATIRGTGGTYYEAHYQQGNQLYSHFSTDDLSFASPGSGI